MRLTVIREDGAVYKDGVSFLGLDLSAAPENVHALQWNNDTGWIEFVNESEFRRPPNETINVLPDWANDALNKWQQAHDQMVAQPKVDGAQTL